jgi:endonuclease/exonuclease/phosphatase family metal-dependent hydrolase
MSLFFVPGAILMTTLLQMRCIVLLFVFAISAKAPSIADDRGSTLRIATYNASLYGKRTGELYQRLRGGKDRQARDIAAIVQTVRPDILLINEIDFDEDARTAKLLANEYFAKSQRSREPIQYPHIFAAPSNTGIDSAMDLNRNQRMGEANDCWGYGVYPGQYAMAVFSRFPINVDRLRTFQTFLWRDLPGALRPTDPEIGESYFANSSWEKLRLSSKNHVDVPIHVNHELTIHVLASHPTPPVFDGREDKNGCRNHDEIRFWSVYLSDAAAELIDDAGESARLPENAAFVIMGDLNADPADGDGRREAIKALLSNRRLRDPLPRSVGAIADAVGNKASESHQGDPANDTANFGRNGNLRVDYVLPSKTLMVSNSGVFWPPRGSENRSIIAASDHRMVWIDVKSP